MQNVTSLVSASGVEYFPYETLQLTGDVLVNLKTSLGSLSGSYAGLFAFGNSSNASLQSQAVRSCKLLPGDANWPSVSLWETFDGLLGGRLIKGDPAAAPCYEDWPQYDEATCAAIQASWEDPAWM